MSNTDIKYTKFQTHFNNSGEHVSANDMNNIERTINNSEKNIIDLSKKSFLNKAFFMLENNKFVNSLFIDELKNPYKIFHNKSTGTEFDNKELCIKLKEEQSIGFVQSTYFSTEDKCYIKNAILITYDYEPIGSKIIYYISGDGENFFPIIKNNSYLTDIPSFAQGIFIKAKLIKNQLGETPKIFGWGILYNDAIVENMYNFNKINTSDIFYNKIGDTILIRNANLEDKLIMVIDSNGITELHYDPEHDNRLDYVIERTYSGTTKQKMNYGPYLNSKNKTEEVLLSVSGTENKEEQKNLEKDIKNILSKLNYRES